MSDDVRSTGMPRHPEIEVQLSGEDGNAYMIIGRVSKSLRRGGHLHSAAEFRERATSGSYDDLLRTAMDFVTVL